MALDANSLPEPTMEAPPAPDEGGNFLTRKVGGLPVWMWGAIIAVGAVLGLVVVPRFFGGASPSNSASTSDGNADSGADTSPMSGAFGGSGIPQFPITTGPAGPPGPGFNPTPGAFKQDTWHNHDGTNKTLADIAQMHYGSPAFWEKIYIANRDKLGPSATSATIPPESMILQLPPL